jgi:outer membrane protein TolC
MLMVISYVRESYMNVVESKKQIQIAMYRRREANEAYEQASTRFRSGVGTSIDILDAHERVTVAESAFSQAQSEFLTSLASLYRAMGEKDRNIALLGGNAPAPDAPPKQ